MDGRSRSEPPSYQAARDEMAPRPDLTSDETVRRDVVRPGLGPGPSRVSKLDVSRSQNPLPTGKPAESTKRAQPGRVPRRVRPDAEPVAPVTVVVTSTVPGGVAASGVHGRVFSSARFEDNCLVVFGNGNKTKIRSVYKIRSVRFDYRELLKAMNGRAREALQALRHNPDDADANRAFRNALRPPALSESLPQQETTALAPGSPVLVNCSVVAVGHGHTHSTKDRHKVAGLTIDLASLLADDEDLVSALAHHLAEPTSARLQRDFLHGVKAAIDVDDLPDTFTRAGERVTLHGIGNRLDTAGPAVTMVGEGNITRVTRDVSLGYAVEQGIGWLHDVIPPPSSDRHTPSVPSSDPETFGPPSSAQQERERNGPDIEGPSITGPAGF